MYAFKSGKNRDRFYTLFIFLKRKSFGHFRVFQLSSKDKFFIKIWKTIQISS